MRIIAGECGGRRLFAPQGMSTRPTADRVKEALFSVLTPQLTGARVLDMFAGSGALALEALSRGARQAVLIDQDRRALAAIGRNVELCGMSARVQIKKGTVPGVLTTLSGPFDLVFLDPPYCQGLVAVVEPALLTADLLAPGATVVLETAAKSQETFSGACWECRKQSRYGDTALLYYRLRQNL